MLSLTLFTVVDFTTGALPISITFARSDNMQPVPLQIVDDSITEGNEVFTFVLSLSSAAANSVQIGQSTAQVTIEDNDSTCSLSIRFCV